MLFVSDEIVESIRCQYACRTATPEARASSAAEPSKPLIVSSWSPCMGRLPSEAPLCASAPHGVVCDCIASVSIKFGDLVDSISLRYSSGRVAVGGGSGGSCTRTLDVDLAGGERVVGFFGGNGQCRASQWSVVPYCVVNDRMNCNVLIFVHLLIFFVACYRHRSGGACAPLRSDCPSLCGMQ
jgi:hypothetical protein